MTYRDPEDSQEDRVLRALGWFTAGWVCCAGLYTISVALVGALHSLNP